VLYLDLDGFKPINDRHGHAVGDQVLVAVARRLKALSREADFVARLGGDEFAVLQRGVQSREQARQLALRVQQALAEPIEARALQLPVGPRSAWPAAPTMAARPTPCCTTPTWPCTRTSARPRGPAGRERPAARPAGLNPA
jgi:GGDEF domain-containing protein